MKALTAVSVSTSTVTHESQTQLRLWACMTSSLSPSLEEIPHSHQQLPKDTPEVFYSQ